MTVCILDTTVFCNILGVPGRNQQQEKVLDSLDQYLKASATLLLPVVVIYETGNHIAQVADGRERRRIAGVFVNRVQEALRGEAPWTATPLAAIEDLTHLLEHFPEHAMRGLGLVDQMILDVFERQRKLHPTRRVLVWSFDRHLSGYDHKPNPFRL